MINAKESVEGSVAAPRIVSIGEGAYYARQFLAEWEFEHIKGVARADREEYARRLAEKCRDDAAKAGINKRALEIVAGGDLIRKLINALNEAEFQAGMPRSADRPI